MRKSWPKYQSKMLHVPILICRVCGVLVWPSRRCGDKMQMRSRGLRPIGRVPHTTATIKTNKNPDFKNLGTLIFITIKPNQNNGKNTTKTMQSENKQKHDPKKRKSKQTYRPHNKTHGPKNKAQAPPTRYKVKTNNKVP